MKVGVIGCGSIAYKHMDAWRRIKSTRVTAVCDTDRERASGYAQKWRVASHFSDPEAMMQSERLQFVSICTPPPSHADLICKALEMGVNVVVEKPLAMTVKDADMIMSASQRTKAKLTVINNMLFAPAVRRVRRLLDTLGDELISAEIQFLKTPNEDRARDPSHWAHKLPGGIFGEFLPHPLYLLRFFLGDLSVRGIHLDKFGTREWMPHDELEVFLRSSEKRARIHISYNSPQYATYLDLFGKRKTVRAELGRNEVYVFSEENWRPIRKAFHYAGQMLVGVFATASDGFAHYLPVRQTEHEMNIRSLVESVTSGSSPAVTLEDAYRTTRVQEEITRLIDTAP